MAAHVPDSEPTIGQLVANVTQEAQGLVRSEIQLAKAEITTGAKVMGRGAGMLAAAGVLGLFLLGFLLATLVRVLDLWLPLWGAYAIVTGVLLLVVAVLALIGVKALKSAKPAPERAKAQAEAAVASLKRAS
ncbi:MAG: phage holin family protein [Nostocoides sp.]